MTGRIEGFIEEKMQDVRILVLWDYIPRRCGFSARIDGGYAESKGPKVGKGRKWRSGVVIESHGVDLLRPGDKMKIFVGSGVKINCAEGVKGKIGDKMLVCRISNNFIVRYEK